MAEATPGIIQRNHKKTDHEVTSLRIRSFSWNIPQQSLIRQHYMITVIVASFFFSPNMIEWKSSTPDILVGGAEQTNQINKSNNVGN